MRNLTPSEHAEQCTLIQWFDDNYAPLKGRLFAVPNGGKRSKSEAVKLKREGVRAGVPDLMLPVARHGYHGLFIEMKRLKYSSTSKEQKDWHEFLTKQGYKVVVCKGHERAQEAIKCYL